MHCLNNNFYFFLSKDIHASSLQTKVGVIGHKAARFIRGYDTVNFEWPILPGTLNNMTENTTVKMTKAIPLTKEKVKFKTF